MIQETFGSVRRPLFLKSPDGGDEGGDLVENIGSCTRKSSVRLFSRPQDNAPPIRWKKEKLIGFGAFGKVYMGTNLDSQEPLAVKQVSIAASNASNEKAHAHIRELEEEVKLLKNLSHPNIVRYLGTTREEESVNILLEYVPGGSISSRLEKYGSFSEALIRMYTKQLLLGLEYLHKNKIMHRDIKGANILVDDKETKECIKLADFGASKQVVEQATAKSMIGTPYWMAPEVILQTGHSFSADIWSVGCTVIEMATGKHPWSKQYDTKVVAALFHIGNTKSHPPIPEHLSVEAKDFLLKCFQEEPNLRPAASELLQHPFVNGEYLETHPMFRTSSMENSVSLLPTSGSNLKNSINPVVRPGTTCRVLKDVCDMDSVRCSTIYPEKFSGTGPIWGTSKSEDDTCQKDDKDDFVLGESVKLSSALMSAEFDKSFNPMCEPFDDWPCKFDVSREPEQRGMNSDSGQPVNGAAGSPITSGKGENDFTFPCGPSVAEDDEVTEFKIRAFWDEKHPKKLETPLYEEFYNTSNGAIPLTVVRDTHDESVTDHLKLPPKSRSPSRVASGSPSVPVDSMNTASPGSCIRCVSNISNVNNQNSREIPSPQRNEWRGLLDSQQEPISLSASFSESKRKWKEELYQELEIKREMMRQAGVGGKTSSPKDRVKNWQRDRLRLASPGK